MSNTAFLKRLDELKNELMGKKLPDLSGELFLLFAKTGNRIEYEAVYFERRCFLAVFGLRACFALGISRYGKQHKRGFVVSEEEKEKLAGIIESVCNEETWALPAHCNLSDNDWRHTVDLFACETASALSLIMVEASDALSSDLKERIVSEIRSRVIAPMFFENRTFGFEGAHHNWNAVCMGSVGIVLLCIGNLFLDEKALADAFSRVNKSLAVYIENAFSDDGASLEGLGYYNYGMGFFTAYAERMYNYSDGKTDLFANPKIDRIASFPSKMYFKNGMSVNFSDAVTDEKLHPGMMNILFKHIKKCYDIPHNVYSAFDSDSCYRFAPLFYDIAAETDDTKDTDETEKVPRERVDMLPDAQWLICESANNCGFAIKGGCNDEPHNHNDVGHFIYSAGDKVISCDLGQGEYTREYFGEGRYGILCCSSLGHSLPVIDRQGQKAGKEYKAGKFEVRTGKSAEVLSGTSEVGKNVKVTIDLTGAYSVLRVTEVTREASFDLTRGNLLVSDTVKSERPVDAVTRIVSFEDIADKINVCAALKQEVFSDHSGNKRSVNIYEIKMEESNADHKERDKGGFIYRASYLLHP